MSLSSLYVFLALLTMASLFGFLSTAPTTEHSFDYWDLPLTKLKPVTTTTPAPERAELLCEQTTERYNKFITVAMEEAITILTSEYNGWGKLLAPAPVAIGILGHLILIANQIQDFPINGKNPSRGFNRIIHPNSFKTTLLQISQSGYNSFLKAHTNMDAIRLHNNALPSDIKDAVRYLASNNTRAIGLRLPRTLDRIIDVVEKSRVLAKEVVEEFEQVLELIDETELAVKMTKSGKENQLEDIKIDIELNNVSRIFSEKENSILKEKEGRMNELLSEFKKQESFIYFKTISYNGNNFTVNLAKDWAQEIGKERYKQDGKFLNNTNVTWNYTYYNSFIDSNSCAQNNSQHLLDLLIAFKQYRVSFKHWQSSIRKHFLPFDLPEVIKSFERIFGNLQNCTEIGGIIKQGDDLIRKIKNSATFQSKTSKKASLPGEAELEEITIAIHNLRKDAEKVTKLHSDKQEKLITGNLWEIYRVSKHLQLSQLNIMSETIKDILNFNNKLMEIRRQKTLEILDKLANLNTTKVSTENVIGILKEGLEELGKLKNEWGKLITFFDKIRHFVVSASHHSIGLVEIVHVLSKNRDFIGNKLMLTELRMNFVKSNEAALLVHGIAEMYVNISNLHIMHRLDKLNKMNSMRVAGNKGIKQDKKTITMDATKASKGIEDFIKNHEKKLKEELQRRHKGITREYRRMVHCVRYNGLTDLAVNFTAADSWFQIKSVNSSKVIEMSSEDPNVVQMWESHGGDNQLWYFDEGKIIRSVKTGYCLTSNSTSGHVTLDPCQDSEENQRWTVHEDGMIANIGDPGRGLDIHNRENINGAPIIEVEVDEAIQLWEIVLSSILH